MVKNEKDSTPEPTSDENDEKDIPVVAEQNDVTESSQEPVNATVMQHTRRSPKDWLRVYWAHKKWTLPVTILVLALVILAIPMTRYGALGVFLKEPVQVSVIDSTTNTSVSDAHLQLAGLTASTSAHGKAIITVPVGNSTLLISKQYYKSSSSKILVSYNKSRNSIVIHLTATGRQVPVTVINKITNKPVSGAEIKVLDTEAKTDKNGKATIVLPVNATTQNGSVTAPSYNKTSVKVQVTGQAVTANTFTLTPSGSIYFLSNLSGKIDVVKTNLDGTNRNTVLAGTGNESPTDTVLLASRDWKYLALLTQRKSEGTAELDLIDTSTDTMSNIDEGNANFTLVGWTGDRFVYIVSRTTLQSWQPGKQVLKSFNAPTKAITVLTQTTGTGSMAVQPQGQPTALEEAGQQIDDAYLINDQQVVYNLNWYNYGGVGIPSGKQDTLNSINADGSGAAVIKAISIPDQQYSSISISPYSTANSIAVQVSSSGGSNTYYEYTGSKLIAQPALNDQNFYNPDYSTYLLSPSGNQTFWSEPTDGKNTLSIGDENGNNGKKIAILSDYSPFGWFTDNYLLVSKNSSELYIMPVSGGTPIPISDYFKPSQLYNNNYGGGYGGL